jgi:hypothetical protein
MHRVPRPRPWQRPPRPPGGIHPGRQRGGRSEHRITAVSFRNHDLVAALRAQHGRHTVVEVGAGAAPPLALGVIDEVVLAAQVIRSMNVPNAPSAVQCSEPTIQVKE